MHSKRAKERPVDKDAHSMLVLYLIPVRASLNKTARFSPVMEDPGATDNLITNTLAQDMNLPSRRLHLKLKVLGGKLIIQDTRDYSLTLRDMQVIWHNMKAAGVDCIAEVKRAPKVKHLSSMFPDAEAVAARAFSRPYGSMHVVLGMESRSLHCRGGYKADNIRLNTSIFPPGYVQTGKALAAVSKREVLRAKTRRTV